MTRAKLSACLIARNESVNIERCLGSIRECVDEIVLVDTGSGDATPEMAAAMGARVIRTRWTGDFSAARNLSLEAATGDWILFLDCDEELSPDSRAVIGRLLDDGEYEAYFVTVDNITDKGTELSVPSIRLFRNRSCFRFQGKIHEQIIHSILANYGQNCVGESDLVILHHGYHPHTNNIRAKMHRNLEILLTYTEDEKDSFFYYNLGTEYWRLGQREQALANYTKALETAAPGQTFGPILIRRTISLLMELGRYRAAIDKARHYQTVLPDFNDLVFLQGACHLACGRYSRAVSLFRRYLKMPPAPRSYPREQGFHGFSGETMLNWALDQAHKGAVPNLAVCIAGDGPGAVLARCIRGVQEIARELVFQGPGSETAYQMGARMAPPEDRNPPFQVPHVGAKWILRLAADEVLPPGSREAVARIVNNPQNQIYRLKVRTFLDPEMSVCHLHGEPRLFRRGVREAGDGEPADITIDRLRYTQPSHQGPGEGASPYERGVASFCRGDFPAAAAFLERVGEDARDPAYYFYQALSLINTGRAGAALTLLADVVGRWEDYTDLLYLRGVAGFQTGDAAAAVRDFSACIELGDAPWFKYLVSPGTGTHRAMCSLGVILARRGDTAQAIDLFLRAARVEGGFEPAMERLAFLIDLWPGKHFLEKNGLLNSTGLAVVAGTLAGMGRYMESLDRLSAAAGRLAQEPAPRKFGPWQRAVDRLLTGLAAMAD